MTPAGITPKAFGATAIGDTLAFYSSAAATANLQLRYRLIANL
jgi:hypothetical protein